MFKLKHDIQINLKNEKEVFRLIRLLVFTFILSAALLGISDYIWNMTLYRISIWLVPWLVAIPAIINCVERKVNLKELFGNHVIFQIIVGATIGTAMAFLWNAIYSWKYGGVKVLGTVELWRYVVVYSRYILVVGPAEELIYRVAIMGQIEQLLEKNKWIAPLLANTLFALSHLFQHDWLNVALAFVVGGVYTICFYKWKRCGYIMVSVMHGMFDVMTYMSPVIIYLFTK